MPSFNFNVKEVDLTDASSGGGGKYDNPVPEGTYSATVIESDYMPNSKGNGHYIKLKWSIIGGQHDDRHITAIYNVDNPSENAVRIAQQDLVAICHAMGRETFDMTEELHDHEILIDVAIEPASGDFKARNKIAIGGYSSAASGRATSVAPVQAAAPQPVAADANKPSWERDAEEWQDDEVK
jgi:hypothetical protein